jgi:hypothetical protein
MDELLEEYKNSQTSYSTKHALLEVKAIEYNAINAETLQLDYTTQFYKDYIIGNSGFYNILINGYLNKFLSIANDIPYFLRNTDPIYWCKINNDKCIQSCSYFHNNCTKRHIKNYSYLPFKSIYVLPQLISLIRNYEKENELDVLIRGVLYAISASFGEKSSLKNYTNMNHNVPISPLMNKNKIHLIKTLFSDVNVNDIDIDLRTAIGLRDSTKDGFAVAYSISSKLCAFIETNTEAFVLDETNNQIFREYISEHLNKFLQEELYPPLDITCGEDFTNYLTKLSTELVNIDNMLMNFPNDMKNIDKMASDMLKMMRSTKETLAKMGGGRTPIDPRETLLSSESLLFRRIAVDNNLYTFYRENNKTKLINSILFWK